MSGSGWWRQWEGILELLRTWWENKIIGKFSARAITPEMARGTSLATDRLFFFCWVTNRGFGSRRWQHWLRFTVGQHSSLKTMGPHSTHFCVLWPFFTCLPSYIKKFASHNLATVRWNLNGLYSSNTNLSSLECNILPFFFFGDL